jgi:undecaprenyl-diphosphatase
LKEALHLLNDTSLTNLIVATLVSMVVGYVSIAFLLNYLRQHTTSVFVVYRLLLGGAVLLLAFRS